MINFIRKHKQERLASLRRELEFNLEYEARIRGTRVSMDTYHETMNRQYELKGKIEKLDKELWENS